MQADAHLVLDGSHIEPPGQVLLQVGLEEGLLHLNAVLTPRVAGSCSTADTARVSQVKARFPGGRLAKSCSLFVGSDLVQHAVRMLLVMCPLGHATYPHLFCITPDAPGWSNGSTRLPVCLSVCLPVCLSALPGCLLASDCAGRGIIQLLLLLLCLLSLRAATLAGLGLRHQVNSKVAQVVDIYSYKYAIPSSWPHVVQCQVIAC
jgi:hypothetical protein